MKLRKVSGWCDEAEAMLAPTLTHERDGIVQGVNAGRLELWQVNDGAAWIVTCVAEGELAVCCVAGEGLPAIARTFVGLAEVNGLRRVRWFTKRPAMKRYLERSAGLDVNLEGYVFTVELNAQREQIAANANIVH